MDGAFILIVVVVGWISYRCKKSMDRKEAAEAAAKAAKRRRVSNDDLWKRLERPSVPLHRTHRAILSCAKRNAGIVTPAAVVASSYVKDGMSLAVAREQMDLLVKQGELEVHASESGVPPLVYVVPEFLTDTTRRQIAGYC